MDPISVGVGLCAAGAVGIWYLLRGRATSNVALYNIPVAKVAKLHVYPVKSCHRIEVDTVECLKRGLKYDRAFVLVDKDGTFITQRVYPAMALIQPKIDFNSELGSVPLFLTAPGMEEIEVKIPHDNIKTKAIKVWRMSGEGIYMGEEVGAWFSKYLGKEGCSLYYMSPKQRARVLKEDTQWDDVARDGEESRFSDYAPILMASEASMELLNSKLDHKMEIEGFRPSIILTGCLAHAEDGWPEVCIGEDVLLRKLKPCTRCKVSTVDQEKGEFSARGEPIQTLFEYRMYSEVYGIDEERFSVTPMFGCYYAVSCQGILKINDTLFIRN